jgi:hypothetical protein
MKRMLKPMLKITNRITQKTLLKIIKNRENEDESKLSHFSAILLDSAMYLKVWIDDIVKNSFTNVCPL